MEKVYKLISENLTNLGSPMGKEYTYNNWVRYFSSIEKAKNVAESDYAKNIKNRDKFFNYRKITTAEKIKWCRGSEKDSLSSQDLSFVMYHIKPVKVEE
jgi:hypothetical protein